MRRLILNTLFAANGLVFLGGFLLPSFLWVLVITLPLTAVALIDAQQSEHSLRRNFPLVGRARWLAELLRPFVQQYFIESDIDGAPISRMFRTIIYQRAKGDNDTTPYGTKVDVYRDGYEWLGHSLQAIDSAEILKDPRILVGGPECKQPYDASVMNISAMSYGSLSAAAIRALNCGAKMGRFYHNTGEGGLSPYHLEGGGDIVWQVGTGYFGCRTKEGRFDKTLFAEKASQEQVKMIELKLSQGAKPGHGGILPASKNTPEIARIRVVEPYQDVLSPSVHPEFDTPLGLIQFIQLLREQSGGKPVGFKLCIGRRTEFIGICKAMVATGITPDFITVDGGEGGTGAAPLEYSNSVGMPLRDGLAFVEDCLNGFGLRNNIRIIAAGKVITAFHMAKTMALGADMVNSARGMMMALGCVQSLVCHTNHCPTGIATQDPELAKGLIVGDKAERVRRYHDETIHSLVELLSSTGKRSIHDLNRNDIFRRVDQYKVMRYDEIFPPIADGQFLGGDIPAAYEDLVNLGSAQSFA